MHPDRCIRSSPGGGTGHQDRRAGAPGPDQSARPDWRTRLDERPAGPAHWSDQSSRLAVGPGHPFHPHRLAVDQATRFIPIGWRSDQATCFIPISPASISVLPLPESQPFPMLSISACPSLKLSLAPAARLSLASSPLAALIRSIARRCSNEDYRPFDKNHRSHDPHHPCLFTSAHHPCLFTSLHVRMILTTPASSRPHDPHRPCLIITLSGGSAQGSFWEAQGLKGAGGGFQELTSCAQGLRQ